MFEFNETDSILRDQASRFAKKELAAGAKKRAKQDSIDRTAFKKIGDMGYTGLGVPEKYGGQEATWISRGIVIEELSKVDFNVGCLTAHIQHMALMTSRGSEEVAWEYVPGLISTEKVCSAAISEPDCGSDVGAIRTRAIRKEDYYIITGEKTSVTRGTYADVCLVFARTGPGTGTKGLTMFLVPLDLPGISIAPLMDMGCRSMGRAIINFEDVEVPAKYRIGEEGQAFSKQFVRGVDQGRAIIGLQVLAASQASIEETIDYTKQRVAFGKPIAKYEGVSFKIAEAATLIEAGRWLCYRTLWLGDEGLPSFKEGAMCKWWCPQIATEIIHNCLRICGHIAYTEELAIEQRLRDIIGFEFADGTAEIMKLNIARQLIGKEAIPYI